MISSMEWWITSAFWSSSALVFIIRFHIAGKQQFTFAQHVRVNVCVQKRGVVACKIVTTGCKTTPKVVGGMSQTQLWEAHQDPFNVMTKCKKAPVPKPKGLISEQKQERRNWVVFSWENSGKCHGFLEICLTVIKPQEWGRGQTFGKIMPHPIKNAVVLLTILKVKYVKELKPCMVNNCMCVPAKQKWCITHHSSSRACVINPPFTNTPSASTEEEHCKVAPWGEKSTKDVKITIILKSKWKGVTAGVWCLGKKIYYQKIKW